MTDKRMKERVGKMGIPHGNAILAVESRGWIVNQAAFGLVQIGSIGGKTEQLASGGVSPLLTQVQVRQGEQGG